MAAVLPVYSPTAALTGSAIIVVMCLAVLVMVVVADWLSRHR